MKNRTFRIVLLLTLALLVILTVVHMVYIAEAYGNSSIIHFISKELW